MPLTAASLAASISWTLAVPLPPFANRVQGPDGLSFDLTGLDLTVWDQLYAATVGLNPGASATIDLRSFVNLDAETVTVTKAHSLFVLPGGGDVTIRPGPVNPLDLGCGSVAWNGGLTVQARPGSDSVGTPVDATHRNVVLTNGSGSATVTVTLAALVSDQ